MLAALLLLGLPAPAAQLDCGPRGSHRFAARAWDACALAEPAPAKATLRWPLLKHRCLKSDDDSTATRYTRLLLDPSVVNHSATTAVLRPGQPRKHPRNPLLTDKFRAPNFGATLEGKPRVLYDSNARLFKLWYDFPSCPGIDGAFSDTLYRQSEDGLFWPTPNVSVGLMTRHNVSATGGNGIGYIGTVPNVAIPCSGTMGIMHDPADKACPFKAMGQFNFAFTTPFTTCGTACSMDGIHWPMVVQDGKVYANARSGNWPLAKTTSRSCDKACSSINPTPDPNLCCYRTRCDTQHSAVRLANGSWLASARTRMRQDLGRTEAIVLSDNFVDWKELQELVPLGQSVRNVSGLRGHGGAWPGGGDDVDSMVVFRPPMLPGHKLVGSPDLLLSMVFVHRVDCPPSNPPRNRTRGCSKSNGLPGCDRK